MYYISFFSGKLIRISANQIKMEVKCYDRIRHDIFVCGYGHCAITVINSYSDLAERHERLCDVIGKEALGTDFQEQECEQTMASTEVCA